MTDSDWLSGRIPPPPEELATAVRDALKAKNVTSPTPSPTELLEAAQSLLAKILETECAHRDSALDLLTADALVTYALESANDSPDLLRFSAQAMRDLARTGTQTLRESNSQPRGSQ